MEVILSVGGVLKVRVRHWRYAEGMCVASSVGGMLKVCVWH